MDLEKRIEQLEKDVLELKRLLTIAQRDTNKPYWLPDFVGKGPSR